jgi:UDP-GlcNAc:undecaprenyl-phosphate/decaprenyl-phosphate GlcNAc-1-phosphate transferase
MYYALVFVAALITSCLLTPLAAHLGRRWNLVDKPGLRRWHTGIIPRTGGIALFFSFFLACLLAYRWGRLLPTPEGPDPKEPLRLAGVLIGSALLFVAGLFDDRKELAPGPQFVAQLAASLVAIGTLVFIERVMNPLTNQLLVFPWYLTSIITTFWIVGMINTVNFLDGLDGLAAGVTAIVSMVLFVHMYRVGQYSVSLLPLALLGATLGFLPFNAHPARVFMGSSGSFFLGYAVATLSIVAGARMATVLLVMAIPILDVAWLIWVRWRHKDSVGIGDRRHLHYRLLDLGLSQRQVVAAYCSLSGAFGLLALSLSSRPFKLLALVLLGVVILAILGIVSSASAKRRQD